MEEQHRGVCDQPRVVVLPPAKGAHAVLTAESNCIQYAENIVRTCGERGKGCLL